MWEYTDKVKEFFLNPKNVGEIEDADAVGEVGSIACGDALKLYLKIEDGKIVDAKFKTFGCASAIASSSALTELIKGKTIEEARKITNKDIAEFLGGLPKAKMHCSVMGQQALEAAIKNYLGEEVEEKQLEGEIVCECFGVTDEEIRRAIKENDLKSVEDITYYTKAGGGCENCLPQLEEILAEVRKELEQAQEKKPKKLSNVQKMQKVLKVLEEEIRPALQRDGGDIELIDIEGDNVLVSLRGKCTRCPSSQLTLKDFVEKSLQEKVSPQLTVEEANE
ncbi:MAG: Nitrogen fixation protein NifU [Desulfonauticus sp. 38_4375]|nr:MAG: Nitrogen fixation protein NifU [Desulfonauticus sp. 38_4375]